MNPPRWGWAVIPLGRGFASCVLEDNTMDANNRAILLVVATQFEAALIVSQSSGTLTVSATKGIGQKLNVDAGERSAVQL